MIITTSKAEFGPRALGHRSLFADLRSDDIKDKLNKIKRRQEFRPFAPVILEEDLHEYFDMPKGVDSSPYMQYTGVCKYPLDYPAIVHVDGTSRVQTVTKEDNPSVYALLSEWKKHTGCPMLVNTSLNIKGKPMVNDISHARQFKDQYGIKVIS